MTTTKAAYNKMSRDLDRINDLHLCDPDDWTARAVGGDHVNGGGVSVWCCPTCLPMVLEAIARAYPDAHAVAKAAKVTK